MPVTLGLLAALGWGTGDYFLALLARRDGIARCTLATQGFTLLFWTAAALRHPPSVPIGWAWWPIFLAAVLFVLGMWAFERAFELGEVGIVAPVTAGYVVVTAGLDALRGTLPRLPVLAGAAALFAGVVSVAGGAREAPEAKFHRKSALVLALVAAFSFGGMFWLLGHFAGPAQFGANVPMFLLKLAASGFGLCWVLREHRCKSTIPTTGYKVGARFWAQSLACAVCDTAAWFGFLWAARGPGVVLVTALAGLSSAVTVALGAVLLRERFGMRQWGGIGLIFAGVLWVKFH